LTIWKVVKMNLFNENEWMKKDEGYSGYKTSRTKNGYAFVLVEDSYGAPFSIQIFDEEDDQAIDNGAIYETIEDLSTISQVISAMIAEASALSLIR